MGGWWNLFSIRDGPMHPPPGEPGAVCSRRSPFTTAGQVGARHPTSKPLLSSKQFAQFHAEGLAWTAALSQMLGGAEAWDQPGVWGLQIQKEWGRKGGERLRLWGLPLTLARWLSRTKEPRGGCSSPPPSPARRCPRSTSLLRLEHPKTRLPAPLGAPVSERSRGPPAVGGF